jgi:hypothetical protein
LFGDLNNIVEYTNEEIEVPNFYLDKDADLLPLKI